MIHKYGYTFNQAKAEIFTLPNARPIGCRPVTLLAYSLSFCTNWDTHVRAHTHTHTHTRTHTHTCTHTYTDKDAHTSSAY